jgi:hypothetical protein
VNGARVFLLAALVGMSLPAENSQVSIQIVNPDASTSIRVFLDRKLIHEGTPARSSLSPNPTIPAVAGTFALDSTVRHVLTAEAPATHTKAQLEWTPRLDGSAWVVIRYYPGRSEPGEPPFFTFYLAKDDALAYIARKHSPRPFLERSRTSTRRRAAIAMPPGCDPMITSASVRQPSARG